MAEYFYQPPDVPLVILYRDDDLVVVDKPSGLLSVPGKTPEKADCLIARLTAAMPECLLVHRLDTDTSGVMVFAMNKPAQGATIVGGCCEVGPAHIQALAQSLRAAGHEIV